MLVNQLKSVPTPKKANKVVVSPFQANKQPLLAAQSNSRVAATLGILVRRLSDEL